MAVTIANDMAEINAKSIAIANGEQCAVHVCKRKPFGGFRLCLPCLRERTGDDPYWMATYICTPRQKPIR